MKVERPVKLNVTCDAVQRTIVFLEKIFPKLSEPSPPSSNNVCQQRPQVVQTQLMGMIGMCLIKVVVNIELCLKNTCYRHILTSLLVEMI